MINKKIISASIFAAFLTISSPVAMASTSDLISVSQGQEFQNKFNFTKTPMKYHPVHGNHIDVLDFVDSDGKLHIDEAIEMAAKRKIGLYFNSAKQYHLDKPIRLTAQNAKGITKIFGDGIGKTIITYNALQTGTFNSHTNMDDVRNDAAMLVDGLYHLKIKDLTLKYTGNDFYRKGDSYFGKINGIYINSSHNITVDSVEVTGFNRAGITFTDWRAYDPSPLINNMSFANAYKKYSGSIRTHLMPAGSNNKIINSYLHHNRVAGAMVAFQRNFLAKNNKLAWNGHQADGGTGYGIATSAGSYNLGVTFDSNITEYNYRKGLDVHDGDNIVISNNTSTGDRLHGIAVYNRAYPMRNVRITNNIINADKNNKLPQDDGDINGTYTYHNYSAIQLQTNTQNQKFNNSNKGTYVISNNTINGLNQYKNSVQTYGIEFRNHEPDINYELSILRNTINGETSQYGIAILNGQSGHISTGVPTIYVNANKISLNSMGRYGMPLYLEEKYKYKTPENNSGYAEWRYNTINLENPTGNPEILQMVHDGSYRGVGIYNNHLNLKGDIDSAMFSYLSRNKTGVTNIKVESNSWKHYAQGTNTLLPTSNASSITSKWLQLAPANRSTLNVANNGNTYNGEIFQ